MRCVSLLNSCVLICFRPNNSTFMTHITVLYRFRFRPRRNSCIQSCLLTTGSAHLYLCTLGTQPHVSDAPLLCFHRIHISRNLWSLLRRCVTKDWSAMHPNCVGWGSTHLTCSVPGLCAQNDHRYMWPDAVQRYHPLLSSPSRRGHERGQLAIHCWAPYD